jgi:hypothetical protein
LYIQYKRIIDLQKVLWRDLAMWLNGRGLNLTERKWFKKVCRFIVEIVEDFS